MPDYQLRREGERYLVFSGDLLADTSDQCRHGQEQDAWTEMRVYRTTTGTYVVEEVARTLWQKGHAVRYAAEMYATPHEVYTALAGPEACLGDLEKDLLAQLATHDPGFTGMTEACSDTSRQST